MPENKNTENEINTKAVKATFFKATGKYYTEDTVQVPADLTEMWQISDWVKANYTGYASLHMVMMMDEYKNGYPLMFPAGTRIRP